MCIRKAFKHTDFSPIVPLYMSCKMTELVAEFMLNIRRTAKPPPVRGYVPSHFMSPKNKEEGSVWNFLTRGVKHFMQRRL